MSFLAVGITAGLGVTEAVVGGIKAGKAHRALENLKTPTYQPNRAISDYYQSALQRANASPYASQYYQQAQKAAGESLATGIGALQDRRSAGMVGALVQGNNNAMQRAGVGAEGLQRQAFGQLGQAVNMQQGDYQRQFEYNQEAPYEKELGIQQAKAVAGSQMENAGLSSATGALGSASQFGMLKSLYGTTGAQAAPATAAPSGNFNTSGYYNPGIGGSYGTPGLANTNMGYTSPAGGIGYIDPNSYSSI